MDQKNQIIVESFNKGINIGAFLVALLKADAVELDYKVLLELNYGHSYSEKREVAEIVIKRLSIEDLDFDFLIAYHKKYQQNWLVKEILLTFFVEKLSLENLILEFYFSGSKMKNAVNAILEEKKEEHYIFLKKYLEKKNKVQGMDEFVTSMLETYFSEKS